MGYLGKNINMLLLLMIIGVVVVLVGITLFFQKGLTLKSTAYETTNLNLSQCVNALDTYKQRYQKAEQQINTTAGDIRRYDQLYETRVAELKQTQVNLDEANDQVKTLTLIKASLETQIASLNSQLADKTREITTLQASVTSLRSEIRCLERTADTDEGDCD